MSKLIEVGKEVLSPTFEGEFPTLLRCAGGVPALDWYLDATERGAAWITVTACGRYMRIVQEVQTWTSTWSAFAPEEKAWNRPWMLLHVQAILDTGVPGELYVEDDDKQLDFLLRDHQAPGLDIPWLAPSRAKVLVDNENWAGLRAAPPQVQVLADKYMEGREDSVLYWRLLWPS